MRWQSDMHADQIVCVCERETNKQRVIFYYISCWMISTFAVGTWREEEDKSGGKKESEEINIYNEQRSARTCE